ncbi:helix-turn-helix domain-containing protein [Janthinobacterium sp. NFX145]|uniref:helix-turn-helix domain-containing protein n=1 Tax=Janthinobacterium sp. NFX145 TaxID=3415602 RepID=UPI003CC56B55
MATKYPLNGTEPSSRAGGRPPALKPEHIAVLHDIVMERAQARLQEISDELHHRCALRVCAATIRRALGAVRRKPVQSDIRKDGLEDNFSLLFLGNFVI